MNILQIANKAIYPPDGGNIAILNLAKGYVKNGHKVHILTMITNKHYNKKEILESEYNNSIKISGVNINTNISFAQLLTNLLFSNKAYIATRFVSKAYELKLIGLLKNDSFDFLQIEGLYVLQYIQLIRKYYTGIILYRPHNIEYVIWKRNYINARSIIKKIYFKILYKRLKKLELSLLNQYDYILPISDIDSNNYQKLENKKPLLVTPFGIDIRKIENQLIIPNPIEGNNINFIGALDWIPNQEGLLWFINKCFPLILKEFPNCILNIAGRNAPGWLRKKFIKNNIVFYGEVDDAFKFIQKQGPMVAPLFAGSGMRVKIIESMALKKTIIATTIAAEGINCIHNTHILLADNAVDFASSIISILKNPKKQEEIGKNAFKFVQDNFDIEHIAFKILDFIKN